MRFALLNVQSLVSKNCNKLNCSEIASVFNDNDIVMFTETWSNELQDLNVDDFDHFVLHRTRHANSKRDSGGIVIYIRSTFVNDNILFFESEDDIIWLRLDGKPFNLADDIFVGLCYMMLEGSSRFNAEERNVFDRLLDSVAFIHNSTNGKCNIILSGDFNSRTSGNPDFVSLDTNEPYACLPDDYSADAFYPRFSQDKGHSNSNGVAFVDFCKKTGLSISKWSNW